MRVQSVLMVTAIGAVGLGLAIGGEALAKYEEPAYTVVQKSDDIEVRNYPGVIAAEVHVNGTNESSANQAFKILSGYIFGKNASRTKIAMTVAVTEKAVSEKIAMTVPVTTTKEQSDMIMRFYLPSKYSLETLPEPLDKRIKIFHLPPARYAAIRFSGFSSDDNCAKHETRLIEFIKQNNLEPIGKPVRAFYNAPWTLPFLRRNEVWIELPHRST